MGTVPTHGFLMNVADQLNCLRLNYGSLATDFVNQKERHDELKDTVLELDKKIDMFREQFVEHATKQNEIGRSLDKVVECIVGNGKPGIPLRLDRLERARKFRSTVLWLLSTTLIGGIASYVVGKL